jgi:LmbE family N-acetylglucosaminyl deacetylase
MFDPKKILVLAPHTDDGELGCGGTITKLTAAGKEVYYAAFSLCAKSLASSLPADTLKAECTKATAALGIRNEQLLFFDYEVREFPAARQRILEDLINIDKELQPDLVLLPSKNDRHQDHQTIYCEGMRAFKKAGILGYELPWNNAAFATDLFIRLAKNEVDKKITALNAYASQAHRNYMSPEFIHSLAKVRGVQAGAEYAEAFEVYRIIS